MSGYRNIAVRDQDRTLCTQVVLDEICIIANLSDGLLGG
jgi:hypothetical protein